LVAGGTVVIASDETTADPTLLIAAIERHRPEVLQARFCRNKAMGDNKRMLPLHVQLQNSTLRRVIKRLHFPFEIMLVCVRWYAAYPLSTRNLEEMMAERGVLVDHATVHRWALKLLPVLAKVFRGRKHPVGSSWRVDETYVKVAGEWKYLYRAVDKLGQTVDFLLTARRDVAAARRFFERAIDQHDVPEKITIDKSGANTAAVRCLIDDSGLEIELRQSKYLNNLVEQDHRAIKRRVRPMLGFKTFGSAAKIIAGIETMHMIKKGQLRCHQGLVVSDADRFYSLATR
jgi:transposase-like protein